MDTCNWIYMNNNKYNHKVFIPCCGEYIDLDDINGSEIYTGCADEYINKECPYCGKNINIDYSLINADYVTAQKIFRKIIRENRRNNL